jgi:Plasma-membrane choline transporter
MTRALTYSFGSICFGSFLVSLVQALRALERHSRDSEDLQILSCIIQCVLAWYVFISLPSPRKETQLLTGRT